MEFVCERELVHLRYELRRLLAAGCRAEAAPLLDRLRELAAHSAGAGGNATPATAGRGTPGHTIRLEPEIARWTSKFDL